MKVLLVFLLTWAASAQVLTTARVSKLNNRHHGREYPRIREALPVTSGLVSWLKPDTLSATDGATITSWTDSSGNSNTATCSTNCPVVKRNAFSEYPAAMFFNGGMGFPAFTVPGRDYTAFIIHRHKGTHVGAGSTGNSTQALLKMAGSTSSSEVYLPLDDASYFTQNISTRARLWVYKGGAITSDPNLYVQLWNGPSMAGVRHNASEVRAYTEDGRNWLPVLGAPVNEALTANSLGSAGVAFPFVGEIYEVAIFNRALADTEMLSMTAYFNNRYGMYRPRNTQIIFDGNSQFMGFEMQDSIPGLIDEALGFKYQIRNESVGGMRTETMDDNAILVIGPYYDPAQLNILVVNEIINDLRFTDATTAYNNLVSYCSGRRTQGWKVIVTTAHAVKVLDAYTDAKRLAVNTNVRTNWATFADRLADVGADSLLGDAGDQTNTTYYQADELHFTLAGARRMADLYLIPQIKSVLGIQ